MEATGGSPDSASRCGCGSVLFPVSLQPPRLARRVHGPRCSARGLALDLPRCNHSLPATQASRRALLQLGLALRPGRHLRPPLVLSWGVGQQVRVTEISSGDACSPTQRCACSLRAAQPAPPGCRSSCDTRPGRVMPCAQICGLRIRHLAEDFAFFYLIVAICQVPAAPAARFWPPLPPAAAAHACHLLASCMLRGWSYTLGPSRSGSFHSHATSQGEASTCGPSM